MRRFLLDTPALEEAKDGKAFNEIEFTFYGKILNFEVLKKASSKEHHNQWEINVPKTDNNGGEGRVRVRMTIPNIVEVDKREFVQTTKTKKADGSNNEVPIPTSEDNFKQFMLLSERGLVKDRYTYPVEGTDLIWEVDVFYEKDAEVGSDRYIQWCKIDLEVKDKNITIPPLPFELSDLITRQKGERTEDEIALIDSLYANDFCTGNIFIGK